MIDKVKYLTRTLEHIHRVQRRAIQLVGLLSMDQITASEFLVGVAKHDQSKFTDLQVDGYSGNFNNSNTPSEEEKATFEEAWKEHYMTENHHLIGLTQQNIKITSQHACEIACDLQAMSDEFGDDAIKYFNTNWKETNTQFISDGSFSVLCDIVGTCLHLFKSNPLT